MNAKKIMGAVLVALLAAALFVGAGAAEATDIGDVSAYTDLSGLDPVLIGGKQFAADDNSGAIIVTLDVGGKPYIAAGANQMNKQYTGNGITFKLVAPTAPILAIDQITGANIIGQTVSASVANGANFQVAGTYSGADVVFINKDGVRYNNASWTRAFTAGEWGVAANLTGMTGLASDISVQGAIYTFTVIETEGTIVAVKDTLNIGNTIVIKVSYPGQKTANVTYKKEYVTPIEAQEDVTIDATNETVTLRLASDGTQTVAFTAKKEGEATFTLDIIAPADDVSVTVTIAKGVITAVADEEFFFVGNPITLSGTTTAGPNLHFYIEGQNFLFTNIDNAIVVNSLKFDGESWTVEIDSTKVKDANGKTLIAGTYPVIVSLENKVTTSAKDVQAAGVIKKAVMESTYATASVTLTQPFITDVSAPGVVVQGDGYKITGTAYAAKNVRLYVFGTNYFAVQGDETDKNEQFEFDILSSSVTQEMAVGTYFYLIQHPMKDTYFNVWNSSAEEDMYADFYYAATLAGADHGLNAADETAGEATFIFNAYTRGTNYAAQALLEEIAGQNIDDIFVQGTFEVEAKKLEINPIPAEVAKGTALTVTGYTNSGAGVEVIVNVLAGKFGATVKGDENAALFLTAKAVTKEDGTFEAKIDTSKLELGSYIVTVEIDGTQYDTAAVAIVAADEPVTPPTDEPGQDEPGQDEPVAPETPGFGALAALAGLGAVAVLLLRRE